MVELECLLIGRAIVDLDWLIFIPSDCSRYGQANIFSNMTQTDRQTDIQTRATSRDASASKKEMAWMLEEIVVFVLAVVKTEGPQTYQIF